MGCGASKNTVDTTKNEMKQAGQSTSNLKLPLNHPCIVFVLGGPGSGKGTQCEKLAKEFELLHLSTGDILRDQVAKGTPLGLEADKLMKEGKMVSTDMMIGLLYNAISENMSQKGFLLDGYPRAVDQAIEFEKRIGACKAVLYFNCPLTVLEQRLLERGKTSGRADDNLETIKKRFTTFENQSLPAIEYFGDKVIKISSDAPIDSVYEDCSSRLRAALA